MVWSGSWDQESGVKCSVGFKMRVNSSSFCTCVEIFGQNALFINKREDLMKIKEVHNNLNNNGVVINRAGSSKNCSSSTPSSHRMIGRAEGNANNAVAPVQFFCTTTVKNVRKRQRHVKPSGAVFPLRFTGTTLAPLLSSNFDFFQIFFQVFFVLVSCKQPRCMSSKTPRDNCPLKLAIIPKTTANQEHHPRREENKEWRSGRSLFLPFWYAGILQFTIRSIHERSLGRMAGGTHNKSTPILLVFHLSDQIFDQTVGESIKFSSEKKVWNGTNKFDAFVFKDT